MAGMPILPQGDTTNIKRTVPKIGEDANPKTRIANASAISPRTPDRDGPAKDAPKGKMMAKPKTSAKAKQMKSMRASIAAIK